MRALASIINSADIAPKSDSKPMTADFRGAVAVRDGLDKPARLRIKDSRVREGREKATAVSLYKDMRAKLGLTRAEAARRIAARHAERLPLLAAKGRLTARNLDQWSKQCGGDPQAVEKLVPNYAACGRRERAGDPKFWIYWQALYLARQCPSISAARMAAARECRKEGITDIPSLSQVTYWRRRHIDPGVETLARYGEEAFRAGYQYFIDRDWTDVQPGEILFSDHHDLDCPCKIWDEDKGKWVPCRPTFSAFMDAKSWYFTGWQISAGSGNSDTILNTLALSIINAGMRVPAYIYTDNGADYKRIGMGRPMTYRGEDYSVFDALGLKVINSLRYRAQAKTIERRFLWVCEWFAKRWGGYLGNRPGTRSEIAAYYWEHPEELPTLQQLCEAFAAWLRELHETPVNGKIAGGATPADAWANRGVFSHQWDKDDLYFAFLVPCEIRQVGRGPSVRLDNTYYYSADLMPYIRRKGDDDKVLVYRDRLDASHIYCRTHDNQVIEAMTRPAIKALAMTDEDRAMIAEAERDKRRQLNAAYTAIAGLTGGTHKLADPMQRVMALRTGAGIIPAGKRRSVKGGSHLYKHYRLDLPGADPSTEAAVDTAAVPTENLEFRPEGADKQREELSDFHAYMTTRRPHEHDTDNW